MDQKQKGLVALGVLVVLALVALFAYKPIYNLLGGGGKDGSGAAAPTVASANPGGPGSDTSGPGVGDGEANAGSDAAAGGAGSDTGAAGLGPDGAGPDTAVYGDGQGAAGSGALQGGSDSGPGGPGGQGGQVIYPEKPGSGTESIESPEAGPSGPSGGPSGGDDQTDATASWGDVPPGEHRYAPGTYTGTSDGYGGLVVATVVVAKNGKIESVILKGEGETARIGGAALEELEKAFVEANTYEVDVVSGATITSEAAIEAVDIALGLGGGDLAQGGGWDEISYRDGVYTGEGDGYDGAVIAEVTISGGEVTGVKLSGEDEGQEIGNAALRKMESAFVAAGSAEVDGVSGATFTSDGSIDAVEDALAQAQR